jgi:hypothetical protein
MRGTGVRRREDGMAELRVIVRWFVQGALACFALGCFALGRQTRYGWVCFVLRKSGWVS